MCSSDLDDEGVAEISRRQQIFRMTSMENIETAVGQSQLSAGLVEGFTPFRSLRKVCEYFMFRCDDLRHGVSLCSVSQIVHSDSFLLVRGMNTVSSILKLSA